MHNNLPVNRYLGSLLVSNLLQLSRVWRVSWRHLLCSRIYDLWLRSSCPTQQLFPLQNALIVLQCSVQIVWYTPWYQTHYFWPLKQANWFVSCDDMSLSCSCSFYLGTSCNIKNNITLWCHIQTWLIVDLYIIRLVFNMSLWCVVFGEHKQNCCCWWIMF